jgi:hypothetical protein
VAKFEKYKILKMKPRLFIGSSQESLQVAYAIQENLDSDCASTVWLQGVFKLSSNAMTDLIDAINNFDFAIFIFHADDITIIRENKTASVRDNIIFELGLFIGKIGLKNVFFLKGKNSDLRIPTDLLGITYGTYDDNREDNNLRAAVAPFCNQVRIQLQKFVFENLNDLNGESIEAKRIAIEKPKFWEFLLAAELLESKLKPIHESYLELEKGLVFQKATSIDVTDIPKFIKTTSEELTQIMRICAKLVNEELKESFGPLGQPGNVLEIKIVCDRFLSASKELIAWEYRLQGIIFPDFFSEMKNIMSGWTKPYFLELMSFPIRLREVIQEHIKNPDAAASKVHLSFGEPKGMDRLLQILSDYIESIS